MRFLKTLFWVLVAVVVVLFAIRNWTEVTVDLWGDIEADIKIPVLLAIFFLIGWLPTWLVMRAKLWTCRRRLGALERTGVSPVPSSPVAAHDEEELP
jgi:uncharacterized integral membrane protein